ncbi:hypothetical protein [Winogradskyella psychrotolerans]|uniref:hypothetical protein n=1 Tax=Winogradskyella psychrotolerans TaxID=1344585 RepID=UPI001C076D3F|nr:hypothetical protein [Winogradskyella psychrotolerans]MBU2929545.1 hypothetical protein [Winogradskyella psychrotolerans]
MKSFLKYFIVTIFLFFILLVILDFTYSCIYRYPVHARNKVSWLMNKPANKVYDYAIFGSSRVFFHLNPEQIKSKTGLNGINLGYPASNNFEIKLMVQEFLKHQKTKKIFIQVDDQYNKEHFDPTAIIPWLPFIHNATIYNEIKAVDSTAVYKKYLPFYRYMIYDSKLGFRELMMSFINPNKFESTNGFIPMFNGNNERKTAKNIVLENKKNSHLEAIIDICKNKNVDVFFFTAPYYDTNINTNVLEQNLPNYKDFSNTFEREDYFSNSSHLNERGAEAFTNLFSLTYF